MSSIVERWKIQDELDTHYACAKAIMAGEETMEEAEAMFNNQADWEKFLAFFEKYKKTHSHQ